MATPGKPRQSGIPAPGRSGIPTPGRSRSVSSALQSAQSNDAEYMSRTLVDAIKANDPAQHRNLQADFQSSSPHTFNSGRRSVAERQNVARQPERTKTPLAPKPISRPPSRHSDVFVRNPNRQFDIGDSVGIDSLALEGTLRYLGEIEGKNGLWAGVELSGQFVGKGKNNGSVNGIRYFSCAENSGVFVATTKLSPGQYYQPTVPRPPSVASSKSGRVTPSLSTSRMPSLSLSNSRTTPSLNGRITPSLSGGRVTPGITPSAKSNHISKSTAGQKGVTKALPEKITPGSRAAKYANMTAKQLSSRKENTSSPVRQVGEHSSSIPSSPSPISRTLSSPSCPPGSPFSTPKPGLNGRVSNIYASLPSTRGRSTHNTPRGRIPSAVAMPPPASPVSVLSRSASLSKSGLEELTLNNLELQGKTLQDRTTLLIADGVDGSLDPSESASSSQLNSANERIVELQARIEVLEAENEQISQKDKEDAEKKSILIWTLEQDRERVAENSAKLAKDKDALSKAHETVLCNLQELQNLHYAGQQRIGELEKQLSHQLEKSQHTVEALNGELSSVNSTRQKLEQENQALQTEKADLVTHVEELGTQVDELRLAGQETIALYEERLSSANSQRYDLECRIAHLEKGVPNQETEFIPHTPNHRPATEIDNEALRDQILYLQKKIATLEDLIEDSRLASEKEDSTLRERMKKLKEKEDSMKLELTEGRREVERMIKAEAGARNRVEEIEEALRESQAALENARAEIESLRAELTNVDGLQSSPTQSRQTELEKEGDSKTQNLKLLKQNNEFVTRITDLEHNEIERGINRNRSYTNGDNLKNLVGSPSKVDASTREEIAGLKHIVQDLQMEHSAATQKIKLLESENEILKSETKLLQSEAEHLRQEIQILENNFTANPMSENPDAEVQTVQGDVESMRRLLKERDSRFEADAEQLRKRLTEAEMNHARTTHDLNKEISELEALVESKIYREDELEQEVERLKDKVSKIKKLSKNSGDAVGLHHSTSMRSSDTDDTRPTGESICEICEQPGHDIFTCNLLKEDVPKSLTSSRSSGQFCSDCETWGHSSIDCPHSQDVF